MLGSPYHRWLKRPFDLTASVAGLLLLSPFSVAIALWIKLESPGPVFYRGERVGLEGRRFRIYKFRTMVTNAEDIGPSSTTGDDQRVTRTGAFLRRHKFDELPQLINVLKGEMSLVGPRPQVSWATDRYTPEERFVLTVRPGLTDPGSLTFRNEAELLLGSDDPDDAYFSLIHEEKMRLSIEYIRHSTFLGDLGIIIRTLLSLTTSDSEKPKTE